MICTLQLSSGDVDSKYSMVDFHNQAGSHMAGLGRLLTGAKVGRFLSHYVLTVLSTSSIDTPHLVSEMV